MELLSPSTSVQHFWHEGCFRIVETTRRTAITGEDPMGALPRGEIQRLVFACGMSSCRRQAHNKVQEGAMLPIQTILHPTDFSEHSYYAFRLACSLTRDYGARLVVLHVAEPPLAVSGEGVLMLPPNFDLEPLRKQLQQLESENPAIQMEHRLVQGYAAAEILRAATETKCDLIMMGTHGRTRMGRFLMGSVAEQIVRRAPCPVLTVKMPQRQESSVEAPVTTTAGKEVIATK
jgi:nucleotide-binding universal stress UspA family protein